MAVEFHLQAPAREGCSNQTKPAAAAVPAHITAWASLTRPDQPALPRQLACGAGAPARTTAAALAACSLHPGLRTRWSGRLTGGWGGLPHLRRVQRWPLRQGGPKGAQAAKTRFIQQRKCEGTATLGAAAAERENGVSSQLSDGFMSSLPSSPWPWLKASQPSPILICPQLPVRLHCI